MSPDDIRTALHRASPAGRLQTLREHLDELQGVRDAEVARTVALVREIVDGLQQQLEAGCAPAPRKFMTLLRRAEHAADYALVVKRAAEQAARRRDKPATLDRIDEQGAGRNDDIRLMHARLVKAGHGDATSQVAAEFKLSTRQVRRILRS